MKRTVAKFFEQRCCLFAGMLLFCCAGAKAQITSDVQTELKTLNGRIAATRCSDASGRLISNRALNIFLSDKIGSYLSDFNNISFYKNNITFNAGDGTFSLTHNLFQPTGADTNVRSFTTVGIRANVATAFAAAFANKAFDNRIGITAKKTWVSLPKQGFSCGQKLAMDAERAAMLLLLLTESDAKTQAFEKSLASLQPEDVPGQDIEAAKEELRKKFSAEMKEQAIREFSFGQSQALIKRSAYRKIAVNWTSLSLYLPVIRQQFFVVETLTGPIRQKHAFPIELTLSHTRLLDWGSRGRLFLTASGMVLQNNSAVSGLLSQTTISDYLRSGGTDTIRLAELHRHTIYRGRYASFLTPSLQLQAVWFPSTSHLGLSAQVEQSFGRYAVCNLALGFPIVLIDKEAAPAANFHFQLRYADVGNRVMPGRPLKDKISVGMTVGVPFSKIVY